MKQMKELENGWVDYWENRVGSGGPYYGEEGANANKIIKILEIEKKDKVLDIGCAIGAHLTDITNKTGAKCFGMDISPVAIKLNKDKRIKLKVADMEKTGYEKNMFDKVFSLGVFEHTPRSEAVWRELNRIMKKDGIAYITVPNKYSFFHLTKNVKMILGTWDLGYEKSFSQKEVKRILRKTGFKLERYWVEPHIQVANPFNLLDNLLNKISRENFGFFVHMKIRKIDDGKNNLHRRR